MLKVVYKLGDEVKTTDQSNEDILLDIKNEGNRNILTVTALKDLGLRDSSLSYPYDFSKGDVIFANGYQSWTDTKECDIQTSFRDAEKIPSILRKKFAFAQYGDASFYKYKKHVIHGYDVAYLRGENSIFFGNLNYRKAHLIIEARIKESTVQAIVDSKGKKLKKGESFTIFDVIVSFDPHEGAKEFYSYFIPVSPKKLIGYTSWYNHYQNINEEKIYKALEGMDSSTYDLFQIDDGYQTFVGDWLDVNPEKFPNGLQKIVDDVHKKGMMAGLWLAPFAAESKSKLFKEHPELFIKDDKGKPLLAGGNWSGFYALNMELDESKAYVKKCLEHYSNMGFDFFKLDFLYASSLGKSNLTHAEKSQMSYSFLRETLKNKLILGCGAVIMSSYQNFDYLRIGPDVSLKWDDEFYMRHLHRERISTKITIQNTIYRGLFNNIFFGNDPDVFLLRDNNIWLNKKQKKALITINALFGSLLMTSDNVSEYDEEKKKLLDESIKLFRDARVKTFRTIGKSYILIVYEYQNKTNIIIYNKETGDIDNG